LSQIELADLIGVKRQAIYDIESGKYVPNTALALSLARHLNCRVEDLFSEGFEEDELPATIAGPAEPGESRDSRVALARVRNRLVGYPLSGEALFDEGFRPSDGLLGRSGDRVRLLTPEDCLDKTILLLGCDPAFSVLNAHITRVAPEVRINCRFASSRRSLEGLASGMAHLAGVHLHNSGNEEANVLLTRNLIGSQQAMVMGFSRIEEGLMVAPGNPHQIRSPADLVGHAIRFVNRGPDAALRVLLDDILEGLNIPSEAINGYESEAATHMECARLVRYGFADAAMGFRAIADAFGLDFISLVAVRCDLVIPLDMTAHPSVRVLMDVLQSRRLRQELSALPGYESSCAGALIAKT
jgi:molybdate-binding protein/DNA-binding XRE family transcriptional regulator